MAINSCSGVILLEMFRAMHQRCPLFQTMYIKSHLKESNAHESCLPSPIVTHHLNSTMPENQSPIGSPFQPNKPAFPHPFVYRSFQILKGALINYWTWAETGGRPRMKIRTTDGKTQSDDFQKTFNNLSSNQFHLTIVQVNIFNLASNFNTNTIQSQNHCKGLPEIRPFTLISTTAM